MKIYVAWMQEDDWETQPWNVGCYSSLEKAEDAILKALRDIGEPVLSLEIYRNLNEDEKHYICGIEVHNLDK